MCKCLDQSMMRKGMRKVAVICEDEDKLVERLTCVIRQISEQLADSPVSRLVGLTSLRGEASTYAYLDLIGSVNSMALDVLLEEKIVECYRAIDDKIYGKA